MCGVVSVTSAIRRNDRGALLVLWCRVMWCGVA